MKTTKLCLLSLCATIIPLNLSAQQQDEERPTAPAATAPAGHQEPAAPGAGTTAPPVSAQLEGTITFGSLDVDEDGRLSMIESEKSAQVKDEFGSLDSDKDSYLSIEEFGRLSQVNPQ